MNVSSIKFNIGDKVTVKSLEDLSIIDRLLVNKAFYNDECVGGWTFEHCSGKLAEVVKLDHFNKYVLCEVKGNRYDYFQWFPKKLLSKL